MLLCVFGRAGETKSERQFTCTIETNEIADPVSSGGSENLESGLAEYADWEAERTFKTYKSTTKTKICYHKAEKKRFKKLDLHMLLTNESLRYI